jgi:hypothetical protein
MPAEPCKAASACSSLQAGAACLSLRNDLSKIILSPGFYCGVALCPGISVSPNPSCCRTASSFQDGRIYIEKINGPFLFVDKGTPAEYSAGLALAIHHGWLCPHDRARRRGGWVRLQGPSAYAAARLRFRLGEQRSRHAGAASVSGAQECSTHRTVARAFQGLLARLTSLPLTS